MHPMKSITVLSSGIQYSYRDSGAPKDDNYLTVFAIHGLFFSGAVFNKLLELAPDNGIRLVAINRRGYPGSTPFTDSEAAVFGEDVSEERRLEFAKNRAVELLAFIGAFIKNENLPPASQNEGGTATGGFSLMGWSLGSAVTFTTLACIEEAPIDVQKLVSENLRGVIVLDTPNVTLNLPFPAGFWSPLFDFQIPEDLRGHLFAHLATSYYSHPNTKSRDPSQLSHVIPSTHRVPTIFNITPEDQKEVISVNKDTYPDLALTRFWGPLHYENYRKVCFDEEFKKRFPLLKIGVVYGTSSPAASYLAVWKMERDNEEAGGNVLRF
ncbi:hypothetical protein BDN72DRAFT_730434, partial [Pluteus cervinus]